MKENAVDERGVQTRFFGMRRSFYREDVEDMAPVDYIKNLSIVAICGEVEFEKEI